jgi:hypothetical protein
LIAVVVGKLITGGHTMAAAGVATLRHALFYLGSRRYAYSFGHKKGRLPGGSLLK